MTIVCQEWQAWLNTMPPKPDDFHVVGEVQVPNPGVQACLTKRVPQGINPAILQLELHLVQQSGMWPQVVTCVQARFDWVVTGTSPWTAVEIFSGGDRIAFIEKIAIVS